MGVVQVFRDISKEKEIERMKTEFVESVSHEFRTPLSAIVGMTEMLIDGEVKGERAMEYLKTIQSEGVRLSEMVSQLLSISTIERGAVKIEKERLDLNEVIASTVCPYIEKSIKDKGANIRFEPHEKEVPFVGDKNKLKELITNLLDNALTYSDDGVEVLISLEDTGNNIVISVKDTGWGIPPEDLPHIMKRFYRGRHAKRIKGTGLGLALCDEIAKLHGGRIEVKSELGRGSEFRIILPKDGTGQ